MRSKDRRRDRLRISLLCSLLAVLILALVVRIVDRSADNDAVVTVTVRQLWLSPEAYEGKRVATSGIVRVFLAGSTNEHFVVEQVGQHRVGLQGVARERLLSLLGGEITVEGVLRFEEGSGVYIQVERLALVGERTSEGSAVSIDPLQKVRGSSVPARATRFQATVRCRCTKLAFSTQGHSVSR